MDSTSDTREIRAERPPRRRRDRRRGRRVRRTMPTIHEEDLTDVPITHEEPPTERPPSPVHQSAPIPTLEYGITLADPVAAWALFRTLHLQHDIMSTLCVHVGLPRPSDCPFHLGSDPGPSRPPWSFFPPAGPFATGPSTAPPTVVEPAMSSGSSSAGPSLTEQLMAMLDVFSPPHAHASAGTTGQIEDMMEEPTPSPTSVLAAAIADFDPDSDDLLDDF